MSSFIIAALLLLGIATEASGYICKDRAGTKNCPGDSSWQCEMGGWLGRWWRYNCRKTCGNCPTLPPLPPHHGGCGKPDVKGTRIVSGKTAKKGSWPWQILLQLDGRGMCGGTIIAPQWILTARHCVYGREELEGMFTVRIGEHDRKKKEGTEYDFQVDKIIVHPDYNPTTFINDIILLKLHQPIQFNKFVSPACLPTTDPPAGTKCYLSGWGKMVDGKPMAQTLQQAVLPVVTNKVCDEFNKRNPPKDMPITPDMICAGNGGTKKTMACQGDSGGPLNCLVNGVWEVHGAASHASVHCKSTDKYTVFARVHHFLPWIKKVMASN